MIKAKDVYLMGICGTAMASLAGMLKDMGYNVRGSDKNVYPPMSDMLQNLGIEIREGYQPSNLEPKPDLVIVGNVMSKGHPEVEALLESGIPYTSLAQCMGEHIIEDRDSYVVAGTHGKSTTTCLLTWIMDCLSLEPGFLVGAIPGNFPYSFRSPKKDSFVIEGDEYDTAFWDKVPKFKHYRPKYCILNSIEFDHADIYKDLDAVKDAFRLLLDRIPNDGFLLYKEGEENIDVLLKDYELKAKSFGENGDYYYKDLVFERGSCRFSVFHKEEKILDIESPLFGDFNVWNVLACVAMAHMRSWDLMKVKEAIKSFRGLKRRQELIFDQDNIKIYEDFAHHPTAVKLCIDAMKKSFKDSRLICFFEPRSATSRRNIFQKEYIEAFKAADAVYIKEPFDTSKIPEEERFSSKRLVSDLQGEGVSAKSFSALDEVLEPVSQDLKSGDAVLIMSNGAFDGIYKKLPEMILQRIETKRELNL